MQKSRPGKAGIPRACEAPSKVKTTAKPSRNPAKHRLQGSAADPPDTSDWGTLRDAARGCRACPLWKNATQTVFGEGLATAPLVIIGEQPGDQEDLTGRPFVGPAGRLLDRALEEAGIDRDDAYVTNSVKHFKWEQRGKRRLHQKPNSSEISACRPWLPELRILRPRVLLCLGSTAAKTVLGPQTRVLRDRGTVMPSIFCEKTLVTVHPSSLLRAPDEASRRNAYAQFVDDLRQAARLL